MAKKIIGLSGDGKLVLSLPGGKTEPLPVPARSWAFLLIDCSSSMSGSKITQATEGALAFAGDALKKQYSIGLIAFASEAEILCRAEDDLSIIASKAQRLTAAGSTNMTDGIERAAAELEATAGVRAIVIVTDGVPDDKPTALRAAKRAKEAGIDIIAIGTDDADQAFLQQIASRSELAVKVPRAELQSGVAGAAKLLPLGSSGQARK
jgi:Mg-chelatase subunit ChlD